MFDMELASQIADNTFNCLGYLGSLASLGGRAAYYTLVGSNNPPTTTQPINPGTYAVTASVSG